MLSLKKDMVYLLKINFDSRHTILKFNPTPHKPKNRLSPVFLRLFFEDVFQEGDLAFEEGDALEELGAFREEGFFLLGGVRDVEAFAHVHEEVVLQDPRHAPQDAHMD